MPTNATDLSDYVDMPPRHIISPTLLILVSSMQPMTLARADEKPDFTTLVDRLYNQQAGPGSYETLHADLWAFYQHPLALNEASREDLSLLHILTEGQIDHFLKHRKHNGPLVSIYELQAIPTFDLEVIEQLLPFVYVAETYPTWRGTGHRLKIKDRSHNLGYWLIRYERTLEDKIGYQPNPKTGHIPYAGTPDKIVTRLQYRHPRGLMLGISGRKYPGEVFGWGPDEQQYGFDVWSAYLLLQNQGWVKKLILGDYQVGYGQGLVMSTGFSLQKSSETLSIMHTAHRGLRPHTSFYQYGFRGMGITLQRNRIELTGYYAHTALDGRLRQDQDDGQYVTSVQRQGLHRTRTERAKKKQVREQVFGLTWVGYGRSHDRELGIHVLHTHYAVPIRPRLRTAAAYKFHGQDNTHVGFFYRYLYENLHFFGEGAWCFSGGTALLTGVIASLSDKADASLLFRRYSRHFHSFYGSAFRARGSTHSNEQGVYIGIKLKPFSKATLYAAYDYFHLPTTSETIRWHSTGYDWLIKATYQPQKRSLWLCQHKTVNKPTGRRKMAVPKAAYYTPRRSKRCKYKIQYKHTLYQFFDLHSELQWGYYAPQIWGTLGYALMQSVTYKRKKYIFTGHIAWFDTDYKHRLSFYERDILYSRPFPVLCHKRGVRCGLYLCFKATSYLRAEFKYYFCWHVGEESMGSGYEKIAGNKRNEVRGQILYTF